MKRRLLALTLVASCAALVWAATASYAAYAFRMSVNADKSVTIEWALGGTDVSNLSVAVDCCVVHTWLNADRSARFTTQPLAVGRHTIAIQVLERYWTNTYYDPTSCVVSTNESFRWMCLRKTWTAPMVVLVSASKDPSCIVPVLARAPAQGRESADRTSSLLTGRGDAEDVRSAVGSGSRPAAEGEDATRQRRDGHPGRERRPVTGVDRDRRACFARLARPLARVIRRSRGDADDARPPQVLTSL